MLLVIFDSTMSIYGVNNDVNHVKQPNIAAFATSENIDPSNPILKITCKKVYNKHQLVLRL